MLLPPSFMHSFGGEIDNDFDVYYLNHGILIPFYGRDFYVFRVIIQSLSG